MNKITIIALLFSLLSFAQSGSIDASFNPTDMGFGTGDGPNGTVRSTLIQPDGKIIIGGDFTTYNGTSSKYIARLNADGSLDANFNTSSGADDDILNTVLQLDGKIIISGQFKSYNGITRNYISRLNTNGSLDTSFDPGIGPNDKILNSILQVDGKIIIAGNFTSYNGIARSHIARLNPDGSLDLDFNPGSGGNDCINTLSLQADGKIIIGGKFTSFNNTVKKGIARLNADGSLDNGFNIGTGANWIFTTALQTDGKIIIGGFFTSYNNTARNNIARLNTDGTLDLSFNPGTGTDSTVYNTSVQSDGKIILCGTFMNHNSIGKNHIVRLNIDGSIDSSFTPGTGAHCNIWSTSVQQDGKIIIGNSNGGYTDETKTSMARLNKDGSLDDSFNPGKGANNNIYTTILQPDGKILIGGTFTNYNSKAINRIARLKVDGNIDPDFKLGKGADNRINSFSLQADGKIIIGGSFITYNGIPRTGIARLNADGSLDPDFKPGKGSDSSILATALQPDGKIIIGGGFKNYNGTTRNGIARLNTDGSLDTTFILGTEATASISSISLQADGKIIVGGNFMSYSGTKTSRIARLNENGSIDYSFNTGAGANDNINLTYLQPDGKIIISGDFTSYNGISRNHIARLNADGSLDMDFNSGTGVNYSISTISLQSDGRIIIGGNFTTYNSTPINAIARLNSDGNLDTSFTSYTHPNDIVLNTTFQPDGKIIIGGSFTAYSDMGRNRITRINAFTPAPIVSAQVFCAGADVSKLSATGNNLQWYAANFDESPLSSDTILTTGTYFVSQKLNTIESARAAVSVVVKTPTIPIFNQAIPVCSGTELSPLPTISKNDISGIWSPTLDNTKTTTYTFTPTENQCAASETMVIEVNAIIAPLFTQVSPVCAGTTIPQLPAISNNGITGIWTPALNNTSTTTYTFTPSEGQCSMPGEQTIIVNQQPATPLITKNGSVLHSSADSGNQWYNQDGIINGATNPNFSPTVNGAYYTIVNTNGCGSNSSNVINFTVLDPSSLGSLGVNDNELSERIKIYPNPVTDVLNFVTPETTSLKVKIYDCLGKCINETTVSGQLDVSSLTPGVYFIDLQESNNSICKNKFVKK